MYKFIFGRGSTPDSAGRAYDASPDCLSVGEPGSPIPLLFSVDAYNVSGLSPPLRLILW